MNGLLAIVRILPPESKDIQTMKDCWAPMAAVGLIFWSHTCSMHITMTQMCDSNLAIWGCVLDEGMVI